MLDLTDFGTYQHRFVENISQFVVDEQIHPTHIEVLLSSEPEAEEVKKAIHGMFEVNVHQYKNKLVILPEGVSKLNGFPLCLRLLEYFIEGMCDDWQRHG